MYFGFTNSQVKINANTVGTQKLRTSSKLFVSKNRYDM